MIRVLIIDATAVLILLLVAAAAARNNQSRESPSTRVSHCWRDTINCVVHFSVLAIIGVLHVDFGWWFEVLIN